MDHKCDVLYIHATKNPIGQDQLKYCFMPMGLIGILNQLRRKGVQVMGMNYGIEKTEDPNFSLADALQKIDYKILLVDLHWYEHSFGSLYVLEQAKQLYPDRPTVLGGYTSTIYCHEILENFPQVDYIVTGDSELPTEQLVMRLLGKSQQDFSQIPNLSYRQNGVVTNSETTWVQTTLDELDCVSTDMFLHEDRVSRLGCNGADSAQTQQWICVARGCKFNCAYCCGANKNMNALFRRCNILLRSPEKLAQDFLAVEKKGLRWVCPSHDLQMFGKAYYSQVFSEIRKLGIKPGLYLECFQLPTKDFIDGILETFDLSRTVLAISPISGNEDLRKENGKLFSNDALYEITEYILRNNILLQFYYTLNPVGETREQFYDTYFQFKYFHDILNLTQRHIFYQRVVIDPLAGLRDRQDITVSINTFMDYYNYCQIPTGDFTVTGYTDNCEVSSEEKQATYHSVFGV